MKKMELKTLVDRLGQIREQKKKLDQEAEDIRSVLINTGKKTIEGNSFIALIKESETNRLDLDRIKDEMGESWYKNHSLTTYFIKIDVITKENKNI